MKRVGIIGGTGPESTMDYYRRIIALYREQNPDGGYPSLMINSIDMKKMLDFISADRLPELAEFLAEEVERLSGAGADFGVLACNTGHLVFDQVQEKSPIPLISIVEAARRSAESSGMKRVGLFGTRITMEGRFYPEVFHRSGIDLILPLPDEQTYIHNTYMQELVNGIVLPKTRDRLISIARRMKAEEKIDGLVLGGTELSLILKEPQIPAAEGPIDMLDTTKIHVDEIIHRMSA